MQIAIDFEVFKALTAQRRSETDSYNEVIRRLLDLPPLADTAPPVPNALLMAMGGQPSQRSPTLRDMYLGTQGAWFGNVHFPEGTLFRATYKGRTHSAQIENGVWIGDDGVERTSPSDAAGAISGTNVNGWRFWHVQRPGDSNWVRMDELRES